jgi:hypothetical protein
MLPHNSYILVLPFRREFDDQQSSVGPPSVPRMLNLHQEVFLFFKVTQEVVPRFIGGSLVHPARDLRLISRFFYRSGVLEIYILYSVKID